LLADEEDAVGCFSAEVGIMAEYSAIVWTGGGEDSFCSGSNDAMGCANASASVVGGRGASCSPRADGFADAGR
jgi:hypothetical protein